jgi:hypothetical protein
LSLFSLEPVSLGAQAVHFVEHPLKESLGGGRCDPCPLELEDFLALPAHLAAHTLNLTPNEINVRHNRLSNWK